MVVEADAGMRIGWLSKADDGHHIHEQRRRRGPVWRRRELRIELERGIVDAGRLPRTKHVVLRSVLVEASNLGAVVKVELVEHVFHEVADLHDASSLSVGGLMG